MQKQNLLMLILLLLVVIFVGCESTASYDACMKNDNCLAQVVALRDETALTTTSVLATTPKTAPFSIAVGSAVGGIIMLLVAINKGKKIRKG